MSTFAGVVKLVDTLDLGSSASRRGGSSPFTRTKKTLTFVRVFIFHQIITIQDKLNLNLLGRNPWVLDFTINVFPLRGYFSTSSLDKFSIAEVIRI